MTARGWAGWPAYLGCIVVAFAGFLLALPGLAGWLLLMAADAMIEKHNAAERAALQARIGSKP